MTRRLPVVAVLAALLLAACGSDDDPTLDSSPPAETPAETPTPRGGATDGEAGDQVACDPSSSELSLVAKDISWNTGCLAVPAGQSFTIALDNTDTVPHNVAILASHSATEVLFRGELAQGPKQVTYQVPALAAGTYVFHCEVHPTKMRGTFIVA